MTRSRSRHTPRAPRTPRERAPLRLRVEGAVPEHVAAVLHAVDAVLDLPRPLPEPALGRKGDYLVYVLPAGVLLDAVDAARTAGPACASDAVVPAGRVPQLPPLISQQWYPLRPGDVVLHHPDTRRVGARTYLAESVEHVDPDGCTRLRLVSGNPPPRPTAPADEPAPVDLDALFAPDDGLTSFGALWASCGPEDLTVIRAGRAVFDRAGGAEARS
ncbi:MULTISPECIES: hypothetical protein [Actinosynnema]|uniref:hypothetical protein n=1 Tax=Actinosynnema TaxID=40566 RepID=UPI0020A3B540|nr:hypothetical protein [Actinosynnema pretiosum]MCP2097444.1 hypothetical protein [Actinosynnema pretiosum]